jgi:hypothetical protein
MVSSGLIDIQTAQDLYDSQRAQVYQDFLGEQERIVTGFGAEREAGALERATDRAALEAQLRAAGVDPGLVGDEFAMMDEMYRGAGQEQADYLDAMGRIGRMGADERGMIGEGIFGGYRQDLRSRGRELGLGSEFEATEGRQLARERALQAGDLAPYLGVDPRAIAAGLYSGVDIPGMTEAGRGREWQTGERQDAQTWQTGERTDAQTWQDTRVDAEAALDRAITQQQANTQADRLKEQVRQFGVTTPTTMVGGVERMVGFDEKTGLTAAQTQDQANWLANMIAQGVDMGPGGTGRAIGFDERTGLTAGQTQDQANYQMGLLGQGIDTREFVGAPGGRMVRNPQYGRPVGFDAATGLTAGQQAEDAWRQQQFGELSAAQLAQEKLDQDRLSQFGDLSAGQKEQQRQWEMGRDLDAESQFYGMTTAQQLDLALRQNAQQGQTQQPFALTLPQVLSGRADAQQIMQDLRNDLAGQQMSDENIAMALSARGLGDVVTMLSAVSSGIYPEEQATLETVQAALTPTELIAQSRTTGAADLSAGDLEEQLMADLVAQNVLDPATGGYIYTGGQPNVDWATVGQGGSAPPWMSAVGEAAATAGGAVAGVFGSDNINVGGVQYVPAAWAMSPQVSAGTQTPEEFIQAMLQSGKTWDVGSRAWR